MILIPYVLLIAGFLVMALSWIRAYRLMIKWAESYLILHAACVKSLEERTPTHMAAGLVESRVRAGLEDGLIKEMTAAITNGSDPAGSVRRR